MKLSSAAALTLALISVCAANLINVPFSQVRRPLWNSKACVPRPPWKSNIHRLSRFVRPKQSRGSHQPLRASQPFPDGSPGHIAGRVKLTNYKNKVYHLPIEIGTPGQKFNMALYTSYSAMWVPSVHSPFSHPYRRYNNASSSTYVANGNKFSEHFEASRGYWSMDSVTVAGTTVRNQTFAEVLSAHNIFRDMDIDGVFGLIPIHTDGDEGPTVLENMIGQRCLPIPYFSLYLNRYNTSGLDSMLIFGGIDPDYCTGGFIFTPLIMPYRWQFRMNGVEVSNRNQVFNGRRGHAELDTSTPLIYGPVEDIKILHIMLGATPHEKLPGRFVFNCSEVNSLPDVGFIVSGYSLPLSSKDYVIKEDEDGQVTCFSALAGLYWRKDAMPVWILGSSFMRAYYTYFDNGRIGFAKARH